MMPHNRFFRQALCLLSSVCLAAALGACSTATAAAAPVLTEGMNRNRTVLLDANGLGSDWVEIHNPGSVPLSLAGYTLSDSEKSPRKWAFPEDTVLQPDQYLVVFCSGEKEAVGSELHASFRISRQGEPILLSDPGGTVVSRLNIPALPEDLSCGPDPADPDGVVFYPVPTPGGPNGPEALQSLDELEPPVYSLRISEYTTSNQFAFYDRDGDCPAWAELQNFGPEPVSLGGMYLSDDETNRNKWAFPGELTLEPGGYLLVMLDSKDRFADGELHADFTLSASDTHLILSDRELHTVDRVELTRLSGNTSRGRTADDPDVWAYFARPTPGSENTAQGFETLRAGTALPNREVWISEAMAVSGSRPLCAYAWDWVELHNGSSHSVSLTGWSLSDSGSELQKFVFPETVLAPGEDLLLYANGRQPSADWPYQMPFQLAAEGETLYLTRPDGTLCDRFDTGRQRNGLSSGRPEGTDDTRLFFYEPTPGAPNSDGAPGYTALPVFSREELYLNPGDTVALSGGDEIRYTLDGSVPTRDSALYDAPIPVTGNVTIRAAAFADGRICGGTATHTYLVDAPHRIAVACLSTAPGNLFDPSTGIYAYGPCYDPEFPYFGANFWGDDERPVHFEFYEADGSPGIAFDAGVKIFGQYSRAIPQKSMSVHLREAYGPGSVRYPFFPDNPVTEYHDLLLRTSGQDWSASKLRDALAAMLVKGQMDLDFMDYRPVALYINGGYWGLYNLRDKINEQYLRTHRGIDPDNVDVIKGDTFAQSGDMEAYEELMSFLRHTDFSDDGNYRRLEALVDVEEVMDYWITEIFFANTDTGNIKIYRERTPGSRWRLILYDLDWGLFRDTYRWDMLFQALDPRGHGVGNNFPTTLLRSIVENAAGRQAFLERFACHLNHTFHPDRTIPILHAMADAIAPEIPLQHDRWHYPSESDWQHEISFLEQALQVRRTECMVDLQANFGLSEAEMRRLFPES